MPVTRIFTAPPPSGRDEVRVELRRAGRARERERIVELGQQDPEHAGDAVGATECEAPEDGAADEHGARAQRERLQHVGAAADTAVDEHVEPIADHFGDRGQRIG